MFPILSPQPTFLPTNLYSLGLWLDASDLSTISADYQTNSGSLTGTGSSGASTFTASGDATDFIPVGAVIKLGGDSYTVTSISTTTIGITPNLITNYSGSTLQVYDVYQWNDKSGFGRNATQIGLLASRPALISNLQNGLSGVSFTQVLAYMNVGSLALNSNGITIISVVKLLRSLSSGATFRRFTRMDNDNTAQFIRQTTSNVEIKTTVTGGGSMNRATLSYAAFDNTNYGIIISDTNYVSTNTDNYLQDGTSANGVGSGTITGFSTPTQNWQIGDSNGQIPSFNALEYIIYNRILSSTERAAIISYLKNKWRILDPGTGLVLNNNLTSPAVTGRQGIAWDGTYYYNTDTNGLYKYDVNWNLIASNTNPIGQTGISGIDHCGDLEVHGGLLYIPMEKYPNSPYNKQYITVFNASDLSYNTNYNISAQATEISSIAYNAIDNLLYISSFVTGNVLLKYDLTGNYIGTLTLSTTLTDSQGVTFFNNFIWISTSDTQSIHKFQLSGTYIGKVYTFSNINEAEGLSHNNNYILSVDASSTNNVYFLS